MKLNIIVISLKRATERRKSIEYQLNKIGIHDYVIYDCFDINDIKNDSFGARFNIPDAYRFGEPMKGGELCCTISHITALNIAKAMKWDHVLILEDDIILHDDFLKKIKYLFKIIPKDWEHIYLSGIPRLSKIDQTYMLFNQVVPVIPQNIQRVDGTCAFFINSNSYDKVIKKLMTLQTTPDDLITHMINIDNNLKSYIYFPFICYVNDEYSYIGDGVKNNRVHPSKQFYKE